MNANRAVVGRARSRRGTRTSPGCGSRRREPCGRRRRRAPARTASSERRRRRDLDQLLVAPLDAAVAIAEAERPTPSSSPAIWTSMWRARVDAAARRRRRRCRTRPPPPSGPARRRRRPRSRSCTTAHPAPAAAGHGLDDHRRAGRQPGEERLGHRRVDRLGDPLHDGHALPHGQRAGADLVAEQLERVRRRADERQPRRRRTVGRTRRSRPGTRSPGARHRSRGREPPRSTCSTSR